MKLPILMLLGAAGFLAYYFWENRSIQSVFKLKPTSLSTAESYVVQAGDTLFLIANKFEISMGTLLSLNSQFQPRGERSINLIHPGETIRVG